jgi:DNA polymerase III subunit epsilon
MQLQLSLRVADDLHETLLVRGEPLDALEAARLLIASDNAPAMLCQEILLALVSHDRRFSLDPACNELSLRHWQGSDPDLADVPFVALDLETTGARAGASKITEIGAVRIEGFREVKLFSSLVNPMRPIPPMITQITGITQQMVAKAPRIEEIMPALMEFLEGAIVIAHNAAFDVGFLNYELERLTGRKLGEGAVDTLPLARALAPGLPNYKLRTVAEALGAPVNACHRALADAQAAGHVFVTLVGRLQERGVTRLGEMRAFVNPSNRSVLDKLPLTRDLPKSPGTYRFLDRDGAILYVGKADHLRERVRSHFVSSTDSTRRVRSALRLVESIDWDEMCSPLEAVVREQELILEHRPSCNMYGVRPEMYAYIKANRTGPGLVLTASSRAPKWLNAEGQKSSPRQVVIGPFRGRARLNAALDLLLRCYPVRRCPRHGVDHPCVRGVHGRCLAPCLGEADTQTRHDALVMDLIGWLTGNPGPELLDPLEQADIAIKALSRQRRFEEAKTLQEAREHLLNVRRAYENLADARGLRFATLWPQAANGDGPAVRLNLVWNGELREPLTLYPLTAQRQIEEALQHLWREDVPDCATGDPAIASSLIAVPQRELDSFLAVRRWYYDAEKVRKSPIPAAGAAAELREAFKKQLVAEACEMLGCEPAPDEGRPA